MAPQIDRLEYTPRRHTQHAHGDDSSTAHRSDDDRAGETDTLLRAENEGEDEQGGQGQGYFFERVAEGIFLEDRERKTRTLVKGVAFAWAVIVCLCAGSLAAFSLYAPLFARNLHYTQYRVNGIAIAAALGQYLPVPLAGYLCDRYGPGLPSVLSGLFFGAGYIIAAFAYRSGPPPPSSSSSHDTSAGWPYGVMVLAFVLIGVATSGMYLAAVSTCAKNFGRGKNKGVALAVPIAAFGLSGMWQSQVGARLLHEPDRPGTVDVFRYFLFLGILLLVVGLLGGVLLRIVDEEGIIDEAVEELERSGLLEDSELFRSVLRERGYGTVRDLTTPMRENVHAEMEDRKVLEREKKEWLLNEETRRFLSDKTMWLLAVGFCLVAGPGDAFINNLGSIIDTLYPFGTPEISIPTTAATHVSIVALTSTLARIVTGTLTDLLAPSSDGHQHRRGPHNLGDSMASLPQSVASLMPGGQQTGISRITFLLAFTLLSSVGQVVLASGLVQQHAERFCIVSALIGAGYGAVFSLVPIIISVVWGVENFGTNWGIVAMLPAIGSTAWGLVFAGVYQAAAGMAGALRDTVVANSAEDVLCHGVRCYAPTFWAMAISSWLACGMWVIAWRGGGGWMARGVVV